MFSVAIVRWLLGWVQFQIFSKPGGSPERFLSLAARRGISLWGIRKFENGFRAVVGVRQYWRLRECAGRAGVRLRVKRRKGLPFLLKKWSRRKGVFAGAGAFLLILWVLSSYIWSVGVTGCQQISPEKVIAVAAELGLEPGTLKKRIDALSLQQKLMLKFPDISWISVNTKGCCVTISLEEKTKHPEIVDQEKICNMKASNTGQVLRLEIYSGEAQVKVGDAVIEGQLLISGITEDTFGNTQLKHAAGRVIAATTRTLTVEVPMEQTATEFTGKQLVRRSLKLFGVELPLTVVGKPQGEYQVDYVKTPLVSPNGTTLPVSVFTEVWREKTTRKIKLTQEQARQLAEEKLAEKKGKEWKEIKVLSEEKKSAVNGKNYQIILTCQCEENIAVESEILFK